MIIVSKNMEEELKEIKKRYGNEIVKVPAMYPSGQTCSCCGFKNPLVKNLAIRKWECPECHTKHDRDCICRRYAS